MMCLRCKFDRPQWDFRFRKIRLNETVQRWPYCGRCEVERAMAWEKANPDRRNAIVRKYNATNPKRQKWKFNYYRTHREQYRRNQRHWRETNPESNLASVKKWQAGARQNMKPWYAKRLLRSAGKPITPETITKQQEQTRTWRTQPLFNLMGSASLLSSK